MPAPWEAAAADPRTGGGREVRHLWLCAAAKNGPNMIRTPSAAPTRPMDVIDAIRAVNAIALPSNRPHLIKPRLAAAHTSGTIVMRVENATIGYPGNVLFTVENVELRRGECAALIGPNGSGKTTFLKVPAGPARTPGGRGAVRRQPARLVTLPRRTTSLNGDHDGDGRADPPQIDGSRTGPQPLAQYLFRGEDVFKPVSALAAASVPAWRWRSWPWTAQTSCCWTSRPTTSTSLPGRRCKRCWKISPARSCWSRTTAT